MTKAILAYIKNKLKDAGINYEFGEWRKAVVYPYFVGAYITSPTMAEDGLHTATFTLDGFHRGQFVELVEAQEKIEKAFAYNTAMLGNGSAVDISYTGSAVVPTGDAELKRIEITLSIKEWRIGE